MNRTFDVTKDCMTSEYLDDLVREGVLLPWVASNIISGQGDQKLYAGSTLTIQVDDVVANALGWNETKETEEMAKGNAMDVLVKQYAPSKEDAWDWVRTAYDMGWNWGIVAIGGVSAKDPLGQRQKSVAPAFSNGVIYVGVCIVAGVVRWAWFREDEWGRRGKEMVLNGDRAYFDTPIAAIADYQLKGEVEPAKADLADAFDGASWDD